MRKANNFLFVVFSIIVIVASKQYEISAFKDFYFFKIARTEVVNGVTKEMEKSDDMSGVVSYNYIVRYEVDNIDYTLSERFSPDSLIGIRSNDTVLVRYNVMKPNWATLGNDNNIYFKLLLASGIIFFEIFLVIKCFKILFKGNNVDVQTE